MENGKCVKRFSSNTGTEQAACNAEVQTEWEY